MKRRLRIAFVIIAMLVVGAIVLWRSSRTPPSWYRPPDARDAAVNDLADTVEYRLVEQAQRVRPRSERWSLRIREDQVNAWLAARLPKWLANQSDLEWSKNVDAVQVRFEQGALSIAAPVASGLAARTVVVRIRPTLESGGLRLELDRVALGRIGLPGEPLANLLRLSEPLLPAGVDQSKVREITRVLDGTTLVDPIFELADGRRVRLLELRMDVGLMEFTAETLEETSDDR